MSQGDQSIANQAGAAFRADLNTELQALVSQSSGASAPSTTYAYMLWADTTTGTLKQRNAANSGWIVIRTLDESFVIARSSNTMLDISDKGKTFIFTSTFTQTLDAAATLGDDWFIRYRNDGSGVITIDPNGAEQIDGATTQVLGPGCSGIIMCNGSAFKTVARSGGRQSIWVPAAAMVARTTTGGTTASRELATNKQMLRTMNFADSGAESYAQFQVAMPYGWDLGTVSFVPHWTFASGSGVVIFGLQALATSDDDAMDAAWGTAQTSTDTALSADDEHRGPESAAITIAGTPAANDLVHFQVFRDGDNGSDTFSGTAELLGIMLHYNAKSADDQQ